MGSIFCIKSIFITNRSHSRSKKKDCAKNPENLFVMKYSSRDAMTTKEKSAHKIGNILS
jgi:hypothetical protein